MLASVAPDLFILDYNRICMQYAIGAISRYRMKSTNGKPTVIYRMIRNMKAIPHVKSFSESPISHSLFKLL
jgi:hypothetical protein